MLPFGIGFSEVLMIFFVALVVVGPQKLPEAARFFGKGLKIFRQAVDEVKHSAVMNEIKEEVYQPLQQVKSFDPVKQVNDYIKQSELEDTKRTAYQNHAVHEHEHEHDYPHEHYHDHHPHDDYHHLHDEPHSSTSDITITASSEDESDDDVEIVASQDPLFDRPTTPTES